MNARIERKIYGKSQMEELVAGASFLGFIFSLDRSGWALSVGGHGLVFRLDDIPGTGIHFQRC
jgi:hypothetical protein